VHERNHGQIEFEIQKNSNKDIKDTFGETGDTGNPDRCTPSHQSDM
jgi:hypothetical protein